MKFILEKIKMIYLVFLKITTGILFVATVYITVFFGVEHELDARILWSILLLSFICAVTSVICPENAPLLSKKSVIIRKIVHLLIFNATVLVFAFFFHWVDIKSWKMIGAMELCVLSVSVFVTIASYLSGYKMAEKMNQKLKERE